MPSRSYTINIFQRNLDRVSPDGVRRFFTGTGAVMQIGMISFTQAGDSLADQIVGKLQMNREWKTEHVSLLGRSRDGNLPSLSEITASYMAKDAIIFVGACGIAVRAIAPFIKDKKTDPAVIVIDEKGQFVIPVLSGHIGGANQLAKELAELLNSQLVLTTATDVNGKFAVDVFAKQNNFTIWSMKQAKQFSAALLDEKECGILFTNHGKDVEGTLPYDTTTVLIPRNIYIGIGCKKGKEPAALQAFFEDVLSENDLLKESVAGLASIDLKKEEGCIHALANIWKLPVTFYTKEELANAKGAFTSSDFVAEVTGVDNVCERSASLASDGGRCLVEKQVRDGMTMAVYEKKAEWKGMAENIQYVSRVYGIC